jgi:hypothetical protein
MFVFGGDYIGDNVNYRFPLSVVDAYFSYVL